MITFLVCLSALIIAYFTYGRMLEKVCDIDAKNDVPSKTHYEGVDYRIIEEIVDDEIEA